MGVSNNISAIDSARSLDGNPLLGDKLTVIGDSRFAFL